MPAFLMTLISASSELSSTEKGTLLTGSKVPKTIDVSGLMPHDWWIGLNGSRQPIRTESMMHTVLLEGVLYGVDRDASMEAVRLLQNLSRRSCRAQ
jgi:hypothetical protein